MKKRLWTQSITLSFVLLIFSGCRFGNRADAPTQVVQNNIIHSELFFTQLTGFETYVFYNDNTHTSNPSSPLVSVPADLLEVFTNPVYWDTYSDSGQTQQFFWDSAQSSGVNPFLTNADANGQINIETDNPSSGGAQFYHNSNCLTQIKTIQAGVLDRTAPGSTVLPGASVNTTVAGHLKVDISSIQAIQGDCRDDLQELANCFQNGAGCDSDQLSRAQMFNLFVNGTHTLNISDASKIIGLAYVVHFE